VTDSVEILKENLEFTAVASLKKSILMQRPKMAVWKWLSKPEIF